MSDTLETLLRRAWPHADAARPRRRRRRRGRAVVGAVLVAAVALVALVVARDDARIECRPAPATTASWRGAEVIELLRGALTCRSDGDFAIDLPSLRARLELTRGGAVIELVGGRADVAIREGHARLLLGDGEAVPLTGGDRLELDEDGWHLREAMRSTATTSVATHAFAGCAAPTAAARPWCGRWPQIGPHHRPGASKAGPVATIQAEDGRAGRTTDLHPEVVQAWGPWYLGGRGAAQIEDGP